MLQPPLSPASAGVEAGCAFCAIVAGTVPAEVVMADEATVTFLDRRPVFAGHCLVVPRLHLETLGDVPDDLLGPLLSATRLVAGAVESAMEAEGTFVAMNNRVSQSVAHLHVHVVPRRRKDGLRGFFWPRQPYADDAEMAAVAERVREAVRSRYC